jgi:hypothetical protein
MAEKKTVGPFVNLQTSPVVVFDENRRQVLVSPLSQKGKDPNGVYEVSGEHYEQFVGKKGPLFRAPVAAASSPAPAKPAPAPAADSEEDSGSVDASDGVATEVDTDADESGSAEDEGEDGAAEETEDELPGDLSELSVKKAKKLIAKTEDTRKLKTWARRDERVGVQKAIEKRLADL